ncbi:MAG: protein phosphatase 2C domain-containing protein [Gammaproteobacteria bacterium]|nr:protein phosphatase 2C domain-containing protein [Gammaproteobacteria bacterium]
MIDITVRRPVKWACYSDSNVGVVREINEDSVMSNPDTGLWAVADGMGGYEAGNVASNMIVKSLEEIGQQDHLDDFVTQVEDQILDVNERILEYAEIMLDGRTLGSTVVSFLIKGNVGACLWVGDSRLYRLRNDELSQMSRDHSRVEELLQQGVISQAEVENHPESNVITRAVGIGEELYVDLNVFNVQLGDAYLLCSDGLYNTVSSDEISAQLKNAAPDEGVNNLVHMALENGAPDNVSVIIIKGMQETSENLSAQQQI